LELQHFTENWTNTIFNKKVIVLRKAYHFDRLFLCLFLARQRQGYRKQYFMDFLFFWNTFWHKGGRTK
jgi:hypothetical protein